MIFAEKLRPALVIQHWQETGLTCQVKTSKTDVLYSDSVGDDKETPPGTKAERPSAEIIPLFRLRLLPVPVTPDQAGTNFPFDSSDESSRIELDFLDHDLRDRKRRYVAALEKKADTADPPQVAEDFRAIAERVAAFFDTLIRLTDHFADPG